MDTEATQESSSLVTMEHGLLAEGSARQLIELLAPVIGTIDKKSIEITQRVLLRRIGWEVRATSTDLTMEVSHYARLGEQGGGAASAIDAVAILKVLKGLERNDHVKVTAGTDGTRVISGASVYKFAALPPTDFPVHGWKDSEEVGRRVCVEIGAKDMNAALASIQKAMAINDIRFYLNGAAVRVKRGSVAFVATNGAILAKCGVAAVQKTMEPEEATAILPRKAVLEIIKATNAYAGPVRIEFEAKGKHATVSLGPMVMRIETLEGLYPNAEKVLAPRSGAFAEFELPRATTLGALKRLRLAAGSKWPTVILNIEGGVCSLRVRGEKSECIEQVMLNYSGEPVRVAYNIDFVTDLLSAVECEHATMTVHDDGQDRREWGMSRVAFRNHSGFEAALMPVRMPGE